MFCGSSIANGASEVWTEDWASSRFQFQVRLAIVAGQRNSLIDRSDGRSLGIDVVVHVDFRINLGYRSK